MYLAKHLSRGKHKISCTSFSADTSVHAEEFWAPRLVCAQGACAQLVPHRLVVAFVWANRLHVARTVAVLRIHCKEGYGCCIVQLTWGHDTLSIKLIPPQPTLP